MNGKRFIAYITTHRGTGRPDQGKIRRGTDLNEVDPMAAYTGALVVGVFPTRQEASFELEAAFNLYTCTDEYGYCQWK